MFQVISDGVTGNGYGLKVKRALFAWRPFLIAKEKGVLFTRSPFLMVSKAMIMDQKKKGHFLQEGHFWGHHGPWLPAKRKRKLFFYIKPIFEDVGDILRLLQGPYLSSALLSSSSSSSSYLLSSFAFQVRRVQGEVASVPPQSGLQPKKDIHFIPVSGITGSNLKFPEADKCPWYTGPPFIQYIDDLPPLPSRNSTGPLRLPITDRYKVMCPLVPVSRDVVMFA